MQKHYAKDSCLYAVASGEQHRLIPGVRNSSKLRGLSAVFSLAVFVLFASLQSTAQAETKYTITDITAAFDAASPLPSGNPSQGGGLNNSGQVTGSIVYKPISGPLSIHLGLYDGAVHDLGTLGGPNAFAEGYGISPSGLITGQSSTGAYLYNGTKQNISFSSSLDRGSDVNDRGQVAGTYQAGNVSHGFFYDGTLHDLGTLGGDSSSASGINASGTVVGTANLAANTSGHAFVYDGVMHDLGTLGGKNSSAFDINDRGQVTGDAYLPGDASDHAFFYDGVMHDLGTLGGNGSMGWSINASGQIVGLSSTTSNDLHAFIYSNGVMTDLNTLIDPAAGWQLRQGRAINDSGQILGDGYLAGSSGLRTFLLTPVPEPSTMVLLALGALGLAVTARRGRRNSVVAVKALAIVTLVVSLPSVAQAETKYTITNISAIFDAASHNSTGSPGAGMGLNNSGAVSGAMIFGSGPNLSVHAAVYDGTVHDLGLLYPTDYQSLGRAINSSGQVTGQSTGFVSSQAFLYDGTMHALTPVSTNGYGYGINDSGIVTGNFSPTGAAGPTHAFMYDGVLHDLGTLGGTNSSGADINNSGQIVGGASLAGDSASHAFLYDGAMHDLGTLGGTGSTAYGINESGQVTGDAYLPGNSVSHAFFYDGTMHDLGTLGGNNSLAYDINASGQIVGVAGTTNNNNPHAFIYDNGVMTDLNSLIAPGSGWELRQAYRINDAGQILGDGHLAGSSGFSTFLLTPVPEPSSMVLLAVGAIGLVFGARRGHRRGR